MEVIASAAGRGRRTVYMYFRDKTEIYNAVVDGEIEHILDSLREILSNDGVLPEVLQKYATERHNSINSLLHRNTLLMRDFVQCHNRVERLRERLNNEEVKIVTSYFERVFSAKQYMMIGSPEILAITLLNLLRGNDRLMTVKNNTEEASFRIKIACEIFMKGALAEGPQ